MDKRDKEQKGTAATASKMATNKKVGDESPSPGQGATSSQNQGGAQNSGATGTENQSASITPQQHHGAVGSQPNQGAAGSQQNQGGTGGQSQGAGGDLMQQAKDTTSQVMSQVQQQASTQINRQKDTAASELSTVVNAVRQFGQTLNTEGQGPIARFAAQYGDKAADSLDRLATYLREQDPKRLLNDVQNFGRRQPALLIGGAFLLGLAGARLIKSSMDAAMSDSGSMNKGTQRSLNTGARGLMNTGAEHQSFNKNVSGAQPLTPRTQI